VQGDSGYSKLIFLTKKTPPHEVNIEKDLGDKVLFTNKKLAHYFPIVPIGNQEFCLHYLCLLLLISYVISEFIKNSNNNKDYIISFGGEIVINSRFEEFWLFVLNLNALIWTGSPSVIKKTGIRFQFFSNSFIPHYHHR